MHNSLFKDLLIEELSTLVGLSQQHLESKISSASQEKRKPTQTTKPIRGQQVQNNKTRIAIALLLQNPDLANQHKVPDTFQDAFTKGLPLLYELQKTIETNTQLTAAALLERFRDSEHEKAFNILSVLQTPETENTDNINEVYKNLIERLHYDDRDEYFSHKLENNESLTADEQKEYLAHCMK